MRLVSLGFILLGCVLINPLFGQVIDRAANGCDFQKILDEYLARPEIKAPEVMHEIALNAYGLREMRTSCKWLDSLVTLPNLQRQPVYYLARLDQHLMCQTSLDFDSLSAEVKQYLGTNHDLLAVIELIRVHTQLRARKQVAVAEIIPSAIARIQQPKLYHRAIALSYQNLSKHYSAKGEFLEGLKVAHRLHAFVQEYFPNCATQYNGTYVTLGRRHADLSQLDSATYYFQKAVTFVQTYHPNNLRALSMAAINLGSILRQQGRYYDALSMLDKIRQQSEEQSDRPNIYLSNIYNALGLCHKRTNQRSQAIDCFRQSIILVEQSTGGAGARLMVACHNIGEEFLDMEEYDLAEKYFLKSLDLSRQLFGAQNRYTAITLMAMGNVIHRRGESERCFEYYERSLAMRKTLYGAEHPQVARQYANYASVYKDLGELEQAWAYSERVLAIFRKHYGQMHHDLAEAYQIHAQIAMVRSDTAAAFLALAAAKQALGYKDDFRSVSDLNYYLDLVREEAQLSLATGQLDSAYSQYGHGHQVFQYALELTENSDDRSLLMANHQALFDGYVEVLVRRSAQLDNEQLEKIASMINDQGKSLSLYETLDQQQLLKAILPFAKHQKLKQLQARIKALDHELVSLGMDQEMDRRQLLDSLSDTRNTLHYLEQELDANFPGFAHARRANTIEGMWDGVSSEAADHAILDYRLLDQHLYCFVWYDNRLNVSQVRLPQTFTDQIDRFFTQLNHPDSTVAETLSQIFLAPLESLPAKVKRLTIIPDRRLAHVPLGALQWKDQYLLEHFAIHYANSASTLAIQRELTKNQQDYTFTGFAPDYSRPVDTLEEPMYAQVVRLGQWALPFAREEVLNIARQLPRSQTFLGSAASKTELFTALRHSQVVHLSMHAEVDPALPTNSRLLFALESDSLAEHLFLHELYHLPAEAELVVLSACETGRGRQYRGDGISSLGNGFLYAGVPSVVMSLWKVPDESTAKIMTAFYQYLQAGLSKSIALQKAKQDYLAQTVASQQQHPYYWAGFVIVGDDAPLDFSGGYTLWWWGLLGLGAVLGGLSWWRKRRA